MPTVDRNVLRIGVYELFWAPDVPDGVAISEAVALASDLSTDASPAFVNGLLARLLELKPTLQADRGPGSLSRPRSARAGRAGAAPGRTRARTHRSPR